MRQCHRDFIRGMHLRCMTVCACIRGGSLHVDLEHDLVDRLAARLGDPVEGEEEEADEHSREGQEAEAAQRARHLVSEVDIW